MRAGRAQEPRDPTDGPPGLVEGGFTLIEVLVALAVLSIAMFAVIGGMNLLVVSSALNRSEGDVGAVVRRAAEAVRGDPYVACNAGGGAFGPNAYQLGMPASANQLPENATAPRVQLPFVVKITDFAGTVLWSKQSGFGPCSTADASGLQIIEVEDDSMGTSAQTVYATQTLSVVKSPS